MAVIEIIEPQTYTIGIDDMGLPAIFKPITTPPGIGTSFSVDLSYTCPMSVYCSSNDPCNWQKTIMFPLAIPLPEFTIPTLSVNIPGISISIQVPPPIFVTCPAFPDSDWETNKQNKDNPGYVEPDEIVVRDPNTPSMSIADDALKNTTVLNIFSLWS